MSKVIYRLRPSNYWEIGVHESWFTDMSAEGYHLDKLGKYTARFTKGRSEKIKYRMEISNDSTLSPEQIAMYTDFGWEHMAKHKEFNVFASPEGAAAPELHTDPAEQAYTLEKLQNKLSSTAGINIVSSLIIIGLAFAALFGYNTPLLVMVRGNGIPQAVLAVQFAYINCSSLQSYLSIRRLRNNMREGKKINHQAPWKKIYRKNIILKALISAFMVGVFFTFIMQLLRLNSTTFSENLPIVSLTDIEDTLQIQESETDSYDYIYSNWSPFAPEQVEVYEDGLVLRDAEGNTSGGYIAHLDNEVYDLTFNTLSDRLLNELIIAKNYDDNGEAFTEREHPELDRLVVHDDGFENKKVFAAKEGIVTYVNYRGKKSLDNVVQATVEELILRSK